MNSEKRKKYYNRVKDGIDWFVARFRDQEDPPEEIELSVQDLLAKTTIGRTSWYHYSFSSQLNIDYRSIQAPKQRGILIIDLERWVEERKSERGNPSDDHGSEDTDGQ